jgi:LPXTG-motif cell wall-anchored protein
MSFARTAWIALVAMALACVAPISAPSAQAASACTPTNGVVVVVDFGGVGGGVQHGCDGSLTTGLDALHAAGFSTTGTHQNPGFICRINGLPTAEKDACNVPSPASAYWSYWNADPGQGWSYSNQGAASYHPKAGSVDGWAFGAGGPPSVSPESYRAQAVVAPPAAPPVTTAPRPATSKAAAPTTARTTSAAPATTTTPPTSADPPTTSSSAIVITSGSSSPTSADRSSVAARPVAEVTHKTSGSVWPLIIGLAIVLALGGSGGWVAWRRRRTG